MNDCEKTFLVKTSLNDETRRYLRIYLTPAQSEEFKRDFGPDCNENFVDFEYDVGKHRLFECVLEIWVGHTQYEEIVQRFWTPGRAAYQRWRRWKLKIYNQEKEKLLVLRDSLEFEIPEPFTYKVVSTGRPRSKYRMRSIMKQFQKKQK